MPRPQPSNFEDMLTWMFKTQRGKIKLDNENFLFYKARSDDKNTDTKEFVTLDRNASKDAFTSWVENHLGVYNRLFGWAHVGLPALILYLSLS
jgi:hypothetical protein